MFLWCLHCERTFKKGTERAVYDVDVGSEVSRCHYDGCDGSELTNSGIGDFWEWEKVRLPHENDPDRETYPEIPLYGKAYPLYSKEPTD